MRRPLLVAFVAGLAFRLTAASPGTATADPVQLAPEIVTATRMAQAPRQTAATVRILDWDSLRALPASTLDGQLRALPAFSLFRRSDSLTANPTAQGVSLRGLGPSGASRSLVLLDGIPLNDPFGGWVAWTKIPREDLRRIEIVPGGGATAWGNAALGGVIQLMSKAGTGEHTRATAMAGDYGTRSVEFSRIQPGNVATLDIAARAFGTDGFSLVAPERRGTIDIPAWSRHRWVSARWRQQIGPKLQLAVLGRAYEEKRGNGTPYQGNSSREKFGSVSLSGQPVDAFEWTAHAYGQDQTFASTFSGVNATRTAETPASDQFAVPATAAGGAWTGTWQHAAAARTTAGADLRVVRGETREHFTFAAGNFTRLRIAGGRQLTTGVFALHDRELVPGWRGTVGARVDTWRDTRGHRVESDRATGVASRNDRYAHLDGTEFSPSAGLVWTPGAAWRFRGHAQQAFRRPTLNELYRPFRVGANVTEANADLRTERVTSGEISGEWSSSEPAATAPAANLSLQATLFWNELKDAIGNVTIARGPGTFPIVGVIAAGGVGRQRLNLDRTRVRGLELSGRWSVARTVTLNAEYLYNDATVRRARLAPTLVGNRVAQVPRQSGSLAATWRTGLRGMTLTPRARWLGRQFEDDENQLTLGEVVITDVSLTLPLKYGLELFLTAENVGNARIETGRSADGIVNVGSPRLVLGGLRGSW